MIQTAISEQIEHWKRTDQWTKLKVIEMIYVKGSGNKQVAELLAISEQKVANYKSDFQMKLRSIIQRIIWNNTYSQNYTKCPLQNNELRVLLSVIRPVACPDQPWSLYWLQTDLQLDHWLAGSRRTSWAWVIIALIKGKVLAMTEGPPANNTGILRLS